MPESDVPETRSAAEEVAQLRNDLQALSAKLEEVAKERDEAIELAGARRAALIEVLHAIPARFKLASREPAMQIRELTERLRVAEEFAANAGVRAFARELKL